MAKPHKCIICCRPFKHEYSLQLHRQRAHSIVRKLKCLKCDQTFETMHNMKVHIVTAHKKSSQEFSSGSNFLACWVLECMAADLRLKKWCLFMRGSTLCFHSLIWRTSMCGNEMAYSDQSCLGSLIMNQRAFKLYRGLTVVGTFLIDCLFHQSLMGFCLIHSSLFVSLFWWVINELDLKNSTFCSLEYVRKNIH